MSCLLLEGVQRSLIRCRHDGKAAAVESGLNFRFTLGTGSRSRSPSRRSVTIAPQRTFERGRARDCVLATIF
jgi:hypothetical protein